MCFCQTIQLTVQKIELLKVQCVGFRKLYLQEMAYNMCNYVFICFESPENKTCYVFGRTNLFIF